MPRIKVDIEPEGGPPHRDAHAPDAHAFFGRRRVLRTLSDLEVREGTSFLAMQSILVPYIADTVAHGGIGMSTDTIASTSTSTSAVSVSAAYGPLVRLGSVAHPVPVTGGWLADRALGSYRSALWADILVARAAIAP